MLANIKHVPEQPMVIATDFYYDFQFIIEGKTVNINGIRANRIAEAYKSAMFSLRKSRAEISNITIFKYGEYDLLIPTERALQTDRIEDCRKQRKQVAKYYKVAADNSITEVKVPMKVFAHFAKGRFIANPIERDKAIFKEYVAIKIKNVRALQKR